MYGAVKESPQNEMTSFSPQSPYGVAKLYSYWICKNYGMPITCIYAMVFYLIMSQRIETFVTRKITKGIASIYHGKKSKIYIGNLHALRDWGHAKDYVRMQWMMLNKKT